VEVNEETLTVTVHPKRITCSTGNLLSPAVAITCNEVKDTFTPNGSGNRFHPWQKTKTTCFSPFLTQKRKKNTVYPLGKRGETGKADFPLHKKFQPNSIIAYVFTVSPLNTQASRSAYTEVGHE